mmetsp:Transcript_60053/g.143023  ORF Transcript_60053/g.143023 Transcript_60053/m.143023 type:complete len:498 (-) Transcript_60053:33-1526(-)
MMLQWRSPRASNAMVLLGHVLLVLTSNCGLQTAAERPAMSEEILHASKPASAARREGSFIYIATGDTADRSESGPLSAWGEQQVDSRMDIIADKPLMKRIASCEAVWVAPSKAAMATAVIVMIRVFAYNLLTGTHGPVTGADLQVPKLEIHSGLLRESHVAADEGLEEYLTGIATSFGKRHLEANDRWIAAEVATRIRAAFISAVESDQLMVSDARTTLKSALDIYDRINEVKRSMSVLPDKSDLLAIGSPDAGSLLLMAFLPSAGRQRGQQTFVNLQSMRLLSVQKLAPAAALLAEWRTSAAGDRAFFTKLDEAHYHAYGTESLPLFVAGAVQPPLPYNRPDFMSEEAQLAALLPDRSHWWVGVMQKSKKPKLSPVFTRTHTRLVYLTWRDSPALNGYVIWLTPYGEKRRGWTNLLDIKVELVEQKSPSGGGQQSHVIMTDGRRKWKLDGGDSTNRIFVATVKGVLNEEADIVPHRRLSRTWSWDPSLSLPDLDVS